MPLVLTAFTLVVATGCGSSPSSTTSSSGAVAGASASGNTTAAPGKGLGRAAFAFARCMRSHGLPNFPDPHVSYQNGQGSVSQGVPASDAASPQFKTAQKACQHIMPAPGGSGGGSQDHGPPPQALLAFARCLRAHGLPKFPDPDRQGQLTIEMINAAGVDLHAPAVLAAAEGCVGATHGAITMAEVQRAINGPH
jgi:hypothetical protein